MPGTYTKHSAFLLISLSSALLFSCSGTSDSDPVNLEPKTGEWRAELNIGAEKLPFNVAILIENGSYIFNIKNGTEIIAVDEVTRTGDSIVARLPVFDSEFRLNIESNTRISGAWYNLSKGKDYFIPVTFTHGLQPRFPISKNRFRPDISGKWEVTFGKGDDQYKGLGIFNQTDSNITGTFLTETGDYRYLEGNWADGFMYLSCFDGAHAFLFKSTFDVSDSANSKSFPLKGTFWSGNHWKEEWRAVKNDSFELSNPDSLTFLKPGFDRFAFKFPNLAGDSVSLEDEKYRGKVVIVQILGSWCPNCMDETKWLSEIYNRYNASGLEVVGLCYERAKDLSKASENINRLKTRFNVNYDFLIAGGASKTEAAATLPMLNHVLSFPTTVYIDRKGIVRNIHTGFYGPGTGAYYINFTEKAEMLIDHLIKENTSS